ncbi:MAG: T9SS type A sorting domain-containing protein [Bacteroidales bacterium]|nr:T9SS type A sorting domain-containing protein [Bacteroidales bacterium]MCF8458417.1 T9SS type A sorting domain-containing protein [Bacteroidales bacterium]
MKKFTFLILLISIASLTSFSQNYTLLVEDAMNDDYPGFMDALMVYYAVDIPNDSLWVKIESHYDQGSDKGFVVAIDTDMVVTNGQVLPQNNLYSGTPNNSMKYDIAVYVYQTIMVPGSTFYNVYNGNGDVITDVEVEASFPNTHVAILRFKLSRISPNGEFNLLAATGSFDITPGGAGPSDIVPNSGFMTTTPSPNTIPILSNPADGAVDIPIQPTEFTWEKVWNAASYQIEYSTDPGFMISSNSANVADTFAIFNILAANTTYYWHVRAYDGTSYGDFCPTFSFTTVGNSAIITNRQNSGIKIYPNPSKDFLTIEGLTCCPNHQVELRLYNEAGQMVVNQNVLTSCAKLKIKLPPLQSGKYIAEIKYSNHKYLSKVVVIE